MKSDRYSSRFNRGELKRSANQGSESKGQVYTGSLWCILCVHCPGTAVLTDHPRPLFYYCKSDLFIHTLPVPPPPPPVRSAALLFILNYPFVSTCTSFFLLIFLFLILRGPGGRGHREHKCIYCPHPGTLPRRQPQPQSSSFLAEAS